jgi:hypothetical protein
MRASIGASTGASIGASTGGASIDASSTTASPAAPSIVAASPSFPAPPEGTNEHPSSGIAASQASARRRRVTAGSGLACRR